MNDSEYNHPIWINEHVLSNEFDYAWSILEFSDSWLSWKHRRIAMRFHYASLEPVILKNRGIYGLGLHLIRSPKKVKSWFERYGGDLESVGCDDLIRNLNRDAEILIEETTASKSGFSSVYRRTLPDGMIPKLERIISGIEKYSEREMNPRANQ